jgi:hypothetical protein
MKLEFSGLIFENAQIENLMKICPVGTEMFHVVGWTDMTKLIVSLCDFVNALKK